MCEIRKILIIKNQGFLFSKSFPLIERKVRKLMKSSKFELPEDSVIVDLINTVSYQSSNNHFIFLLLRKKLKNHLKCQLRLTALKSN